MKNYKSVVRVAVNNNFNCTKDEFNQVDGFKKVSPESFFFINANIKTRQLLNINDTDYKAVITVNPDIKINKSSVERLYKVNKSNVGFVRVKYIPNVPAIEELIREISEKGYNVVVTAMRFKSNKTVAEYSEKKFYNYDHSWFRLKPEILSKLESFVDSLNKTYICDRKSLGCSACGLCSKLTSGKDLDLLSLNLSSSGVCKFNCIDCFAKKMQAFLIGAEKSPMTYDVIKKNQKQKGDTAHIKSVQKQCQK